MSNEINSVNILYMESKVKGTKSKRISKKEIAYQYIRGNILNGNFSPGYRVVIDQIKRTLNLSSIPVREAIQQLEAEGLVQIIPYSGAVVRLVQEKDYIETQFLIAVLDGVATSLAVDYLSLEDLKRLEMLNEEMQVSIHDLDLERFGKLNAEFHQYIYSKCRNQYLIDILSDVWQRMIHIRQSIYTFVPSRARESITEHATLIDMLRHHDSTQAIEKFARQHKLEMLEAVKEALKNR